MSQKMDWTTTNGEIPKENFNTDVVYGGNRIFWLKLGRIVFLQCQPLHFKTDANTVGVVATGLPKPLRSGWFFTATCANTNGGKIRLSISANGELVLGGVVSTKNTDEYWATFVYLAKE